ncbi:hypothetical protein LSCM1_01663 [Leishmania martiniquensis]|uniref:Protein kinase domain-containing protein n=1 Tax=Leishmania martiniquensis TaxID=1580590 RepID=A0A836KBL1_9TRYP|nr:hypothetical protein LSCM1_01663 [Leishmania martiniquensis]
MALRFQRLLVQDSDEDSSAGNVRRSTATGMSPAAAQKPAAPIAVNGGVSVVTPASAVAAAATREATAPNEMAKAATRTATPLNQSVTSSKYFEVESTSPGVEEGRRPNMSTDLTSVTFQEDPLPRPRAMQASSSLQSINFSVASPVSAQSVRSDRASMRPELTVERGAEGVSTRNSTRAPTANANVSASQDESKGSLFFWEEQSQLPAAATDGATPVASGTSVASDGHSKKDTKAAPRVVARRQKGSIPSDSGEAMRADEQLARPEGADDAAPAAASTSRQETPPPVISSTRSRQAAESRSSSVSATPPEGFRTPGGGRGAEAALKSARSFRTNPSVSDSPLPLKGFRPGPRQLNRNATPRSVTTGADTPMEFEVLADTTAGTPNFRTDDTISFYYDGGSAATPRRTADSGGPDLRRRPKIPSPSAIDDCPTPLIVDEKGQAMPIHRPKVRQTITTDGRETWMLYSPRRGNSAATCVREIPAPPLKLSQRAQDILAAKRRALENDAKKRQADSEKDRTASEKPLRFLRRSRPSLAFHPSSFYTDDVARQHGKEAEVMQDKMWTAFVYDGMAVCAAARRASSVAGKRSYTEKVVRTLQPVQVAPAEGTTDTCGCVVYDWTHKDDALRQLIDSGCAREDGVRRFLNLQPMQLANVETQHMVDPPLESPRRGSVSPSEAQSALEAGQKSAAEQRGLATLGGLWCTVEALRENGRPVTRKDIGAQRRIMRICGGQAIRVPSGPDSSETFDVRCYELLLFPRESLNPSAVNYGSEGLTLGQVVAPPASSFPLTPRIVDNPVALKEYKKRLLTTKSRQAALANCEDDRATFAAASAAGGEAGGSAGQYLTLTTVSISSRQKYAIELTLLMLPFRSRGIFDGKTVAEVPRFCAATVMSHRRLQGLSLSFSTKSAFMSAYKALLWATECDIVDIQPPTNGEEGSVPGAVYSRLRVCATTSPMLPWVSSFGKDTTRRPKEETFHGSCLDFAVLTLAAPPEAVQKTDGGGREPLTLEDFVITDAEHSAAELGDDAGSGRSGAPARQQRCSTIFRSTLDLRKNSEENRGGAVSTTDTLVGFTAFGVIRRAVSQKTSEVFDVRVMPRNRGRIAPTACDGTAAMKDTWAAVGGQTARRHEEHLLQQDVEAAIMIEYVSRLPFHSRVYGVLVDEQRYYIFQEPWISALSLEESTRSSCEHDALKYNERLSSMTRRMTIMSLKDFIHAVLRPDVYTTGPKEEVWLEIARVLAAQLLLLLTSLHGKGMLLGPCPPQRLLVRVTGPDKGSDDAEGGSTVDTPEKAAPPAPMAKSSDIQLFVPDIGISTLAWSYEHQQCGVLEYLPPMYVLRQMLSNSFSEENCTWTMRDDWWTYLTLCFELFAGDGSALVAPETAAAIPTPTPTLTNFFSPVDILDVWQKVIADATSDVFSTAAETIAMRTRRYVRQRVLKSVSRFVDSWVMTKAEEMQYFGTTGSRRGRHVVRAVPPPSGGQGKAIGVSLAAMYLKNAQETSETTSITFHSEGDEGGDATAENIVADMRWLFQVRDFFDTILDAVFSPTPCSVHGPALRLVSHPFFQGMELTKVFDGSHTYSAAVLNFAKTHLSKSNLQAALLSYRTRAYRGLSKLQRGMPLMITSAAYNTSGGASTGVPLLMLSSLASHDNEAAHDREDSASWQEAANPTEGLVLSRTNSMAFSAAPSPRSQSPATGVWAQQKLKAMYDPTEWQSIAALQTEVRDALSSHGPRESVSSRRASVEVDYASDPLAGSGQPKKPVRRNSGLARTDTTSLTSSGRRRDPLEYEQVVDAKAAPTSAEQPRRAAYGGTSRSLRGDAKAKKSRFVFRHTNTAPFVDPVEHGAAYENHPVTRRDSQRGASLVAAMGPGGHTRREATPARRPHRYTETSELERSLNDLAMGCCHHLDSVAAAFSPDSNGGVALGYGPGYMHRQDRSHPQGSRLSSRHSSRAEPEEYKNQRSWPKEFLDAATLHKKGRPRGLRSQQNAIADSSMTENQTRGSVQSLESSSHHRAGIVRDASRRYASRGSSSEKSYILVPSDGEAEAESAAMSTYRSSDINRKSPVPRNPRAFSIKEIASNRTAYFEF